MTTRKKNAKADSDRQEDDVRIVMVRWGFSESEQRTLIEKILTETTKDVLKPPPSV
jgi:hypothetical protein